MYRIKEIIFIATFLFGNVAESQTLTIINQDFEQAKQKAIQEKKLLLIDFYTSWCGPCKVLDKKIFQSAENSNKLANDFVVLKYDAEKDSLHKLSLKFHIKSYPTTIIINVENGKTIDKMYGLGGGLNMNDLDSFYFAFTNNCIQLNKEKNYINGISNNYNLNYPKFYIDHVNRTNVKLITELEDYWKNNTTDYFSEVPFCILYYFEGNETVNKFFISNKEQFIELYGKKDVQNVINDIVYKYFDQSIKHKNETEYEIAKKECYRLCIPEDAKIYINYFEKEYLIATENWSSLDKLISSQENELLINGEMNQICWTIFEKCNDPNITKKSSIWMKKLVTLSPSYANLDTYANLLFKIGDKKNGILQMEKAIEMGKKEGQDTSDSEKILKKYKNN